MGVRLRTPVTEGVGVQSRGGEVIEIRPGDVISTPPGEWHWHGTAPGHFMTHIAMWEAPQEGPETEWGEHVTDAAYPGAEEGGEVVAGGAAVGE